MNEELSQAELLDRIVADYTRQTREGSAPEIAQYKKKYPKLADEIDDLLTSVAMIEGLKADDTQKSHTDPAAVDFSGLKQLGDYVIIREVGRGGMGVVFEAVHQSLGRRVALKVMLEKELESEKNITRFRREAQAAAKLHHTNIVSVFGVGESSGYHYYVMEYIDGISLKSAVRSLTRGESSDGPLSAPEELSETARVSENSTDEHDHTAELILSGSAIFAPGPTELNRTASHRSSRSRHLWVARIGAQIADALGYSHQQGILHRDIKPANLMLDNKEHVWITDFGLVKFSDEDGITKTGAVIGTPQYLAPESLKGDYDHRSETYCLGLTLYELATLTPAFEPGTTAEVFSRIIHETPQPPAKADPSIPRDLATIIQKAISGEPDQRYKTALALRDDLRAFLDDRPISARRPSLSEQSWRWSRKNPLLASLVALSAALVCATAIIATSAWMMTNRAYSDLKVEATKTEVARKQAENARTDAEEKKLIAVKSLSRSESNVGLMVEAFDELFAAFLKKGTDGTEGKLDFEGFNELAGIEISIDKADADYLKTMASFYERFARQNSENQALLGNAAKGWRRVANINFLLGDTETAIASYNQAIRAYVEVQQRNPESVAALLNLVDTRSELSGAIVRQRRFVLSKNKLKPKTLIAANVQDIEKHPQSDSHQLQFALARTLGAMGSAELCRLATENTVDLEQPWRGENQATRRKRDSVYFKQLKKSVKRAIKIAARLAAADPGNLQYQTLLAKSHCSLGAVEARLGDPELANDSLEFAAEKYSQLAKDHPGNLQYQYELAVTLLLLPSDENRRKERKKIWDVNRIADELASKSPNLVYRQLQIASRLKMAAAFVSNKKRSQALEQFHQAADLLITAKLEGPALHSMLREIMKTFRIVTRRMMPTDRDNFHFFLQQKLRRELDMIPRRRGNRPQGLRVGVGTSAVNPSFRSQN